MNTARGPLEGRDEQGERRELARLLPPPPHPEMAAESLKEFLLNEIDLHPRARTPATTLPLVSADAPAPVRSVRRWPRLTVVTAVATAVAVAVVVSVHSGGGPAEQAPPATAASVRLLDRIARAAYVRPQTAVRDTQYSYVRTVGHSTSLSEAGGGTMRRATTTEDIEEWVAVDGGRPGLQRGAGGDRAIPAPGGGSLNSPTHKLLSALPTDPEALLRQIYADADLNHGTGSGSTTGPDQEAFTAIGDLLRSSVAPPGVSAALYRAAGRIPGVVTVADAVDATGRHGVAVARVHNGERSEWIFDRQTLRLLGERTVLLADGPWGAAGDEVTSVAVVARGITDAPGQTPAEGSDNT
ncbi:CU044_5270 family protein [Kitasatospora sp. NBC_01539]|uniref:CU044_5270 family protein n=1 Tax=Kitasatospora sp. NBC_01539 TaxID=2903577 RepID=UPI0038603188